MNTGTADARTWANELLRREMKGPGDMENAMRRLEYRYGIPWRTFWELRYRPPADVLIGLYRRLGAAYQAEIERQQGLLRHELEITKIKCGAASAAVVQTEAFLSEMEG